MNISSYKTVVEPPETIDSEVMKVEIKEGHNGQLTCPVQSGTPEPTIRWLKVNIVHIICRTSRNYIQRSYNGGNCREQHWTGSPEHIIL